MAQVPPSAPPDARPIRVARAEEEGAAMPMSLPPSLAGVAARAFPLRRAGTLVLVSALYFTAAKLGLLLAVVHASATAVWPPTGIALASLLLLGDGAWPAIALGAFLANITTHGTAATCAGIAAGNTLEALAGAWLVRRYAHGRDAFLSGHDAFRFTVLAGVLATTISATLGVLSLTLAGDATWARFGSIWVTWWLGDMGGATVVAPLILIWSHGARNRWTRARVIEAVCAFAALLVFGQGIFGWLAPVGADPVVFKFLCLPILTWIAYRFDPRAAATGVFALAAIAVAGTLRAALASPGALNGSLVLLQVYLAATAMSTLVLAAAVYERAQVELALRGTSTQLREAVTELEAFSHAISHDLRSPLGAIHNYALTLEQDHATKLGSASVHELTRIRAGTMSMKTVLDELAKFLWAGQSTISKRLLDMTELARVACAEVVVGTEDGSAVRFEVTELPPAHGDPQMLGRVLANLLSNAVKFTRGRETRRVVISGRVEGHENVYSVTDNGVGFDPKLATEVFLPFRNPETRAKFEGTGLGLAIAARIVRRHGGRFGAESDGTSGARFWFTLPHGGNDEPVSGGPADR